MSASSRSRSVRSPGPSGRESTLLRRTSPTRMSGAGLRACGSFGRAGRLALVVLRREELEREAARRCPVGEQVARMASVRWSIAGLCSVGPCDCRGPPARSDRSSTVDRESRQLRPTPPTRPDLPSSASRSPTSRGVHRSKQTSPGPDRRRPHAPRRDGSHRRRRRQAAPTGVRLLGLARGGRFARPGPPSSRPRRDRTRPCQRPRPRRRDGRLRDPARRADSAHRQLLPRSPGGPAFGGVRAVRHERGHPARRHAALVVRRIAHP